MQYVEAGENGTIAESSQQLSAVARGDQAPETVIENGTLVNVHTGELQEDVTLVLTAGRIARVVPPTESIEIPEETERIDADGQYLAPGFIDTHVHYESSMVTATGFCRGVVPTGTTAAFMDPHEIGNVLGLEGIRALLDEAADLPLKTFCTIPSCVPAAPGFEDAGAEIDAAAIEEALEWDDVVALGEMMNYPGVIAGDDEVHNKLAATYRAEVPATGHYASRDLGAPLDAFVASGITACHESVRREEALAKLRRGVWTQLRQGSAWKDIPETIKAITETDVDTRHLLLVTDDTHPDTITENGHLDRVLRVAIANGLDPITAIQAVTLNAAEYYNVDGDLGALSPGKIADIVFLDDLATVAVERVMVNGELVASDGEWIAPEAVGLPKRDQHTESVQSQYPEKMTNTVHLQPPGPDAFEITAPQERDTVTANAMGIIENQVGTTREEVDLPVSDGVVELTDEISKIAVFERHGGDESVGLGFVTGFGFEAGAVASTVAHDSHNLLVVGTSDEAMVAAAQRLIDIDGGWVAIDDAGDVLAEVPLPVAGLMSDQPIDVVSDRVQKLEQAFEALGCTVESPFMTMSLLPLAVIPELRLTNRGLVDTVAFEFVEPIP